MEALPPKSHSFVSCRAGILRLRGGQERGLTGAVHLRCPSCRSSKQAPTATPFLSRASTTACSASSVRPGDRLAPQLHNCSTVGQDTRSPPPARPPPPTHPPQAVSRPSARLRMRASGRSGPSTSSCSPPRSRRGSACRAPAGAPGREKRPEPPPRRAPPLASEHSTRASSALDRHPPPLPALFRSSRAMAGVLDVAKLARLTDTAEPNGTFAKAAAYAGYGARACCGSQFAARAPSLDVAPFGLTSETPQRAVTRRREEPARDCGRRPRAQGRRARLRRAPHRAGCEAGATAAPLDWPAVSCRACRHLPVPPSPAATGPELEDEGLSIGIVTAIAAPAAMKARLACARSAQRTTALH